MLEQEEHQLRKSLEGIPLPADQLGKALRRLEKQRQAMPQAFSVKDDSAFWDFLAKIQKTASLLKIDTLAYLKWIIKNPQILFRSPDTIHAHIVKTAALLGISEERYVKAVMRQPSIIGSAPKRINDNVNRLAALLNVDRGVIIEAGLTKPPIFYQSPRTLYKNIKGGAAAVGARLEDYLEAAIDRPDLFLRAPETIHKNFRAIFHAHAQGYIKSDDILADCLKYPINLSYSANNTNLRIIHARIHNKSFSLGNFFDSAHRRHGTVENQVVAYYRHQYETEGTGLSEIWNMVDNKMITKTPDWLPPRP